MSNISEIISNMADLNEQETLEIVRKQMQFGEDVAVIMDQCKRAMEMVGIRFEKGDYFLADLMYAADIFKKITEITQPFMHGKEEKIGKVLLATVEDDIHDIGKNLVASMMGVYGLEVVDLGVNVPPKNICSAILEHNPDIVALSCLLTLTIDSMERTIKVIKENSLRDKVRIIVGGFPITEKISLEIGSDAYGKDASEGARKCLELLGKVR